MIAPRQWSDHRRFRKGLAVLGWSGLSVFVVLTALIVAAFITGSGKMAILGLAGTLGMLALLLIIPNPRMGVYFLFAFMPFAGWAFKQSPGGGFNLLDDALGAVVFVGLLLHRKERTPPPSLAIPIVLLMVLGLVETVNPIGGGDGVVAVYAIRDVVIPMLLFFVGFYAFQTVPQVEKFLAFLMLIAIVNGAWATKQSVLGLDAGEYAWANPLTPLAFYTDTGQLRAFGTFQAPWAFAYYTDILFVVAVCLLIGTRSDWIRLLAAISLPFTLAGLYFSVVRTSWVVLPVALVLVVLLRLRGQLRVLGILFVVIGALTLLMAMTSLSLPNGSNPNGMAQTLSTANILQDPSMRARFVNWSTTIIPQLGQYPFGKGLGTTGGVGAMNPNGAVTTDNNYLSIAIEMGWAGMVIFCFMLGAALVNGLRWHERTVERSRGWLIAGLVAVVVTTILANFLNENTNQAGGDYFYMFLGLLAFLGTSGRAQPAVPSLKESVG